MQKLCLSFSFTFWIRNWSHIATHLTVLLVVVLDFVGATLFKNSPRFRRFKSDRDESWQDCLSSWSASTDVVGFQIRYHNFKMAAMMSFRAEKLYHLISEHAASAPHNAHIRSSVRQFLILSTSEIVLANKGLFMYVVCILHFTAKCVILTSSALKCVYWTS